MIVCVCRRVSDRDIEREVRSGCRSFEVLQDDLQIGTACGACTDCARKTFDAQCSSAQGAAGSSAGAACSRSGGASRAPGLTARSGPCSAFGAIG